ncbi:MAG: hypothetical protein JWR73_1077, partial [Tardiphaga sp.]|nr:hypothetical protein [Tardiphaga sp.]
FEAKPSEAKAGDGSADKSAFEKAVAEKAAIEKTAEKAASEKAANDRTGTDRPSDSAESRKHLPAPKVAAKPAPAPAADERRANDLARAAIERLAKSEAKSEPKSEPKTELSRTESSRAESKPADAPRLQPASTAVSAPPMQPLPPAINVATPNPDVFEQGNAAPVVRQPYPQAASRSDDAREPRRFAPPADIPTSRPLDLRAEAMSPSSSERTSVTDEVVSVAKSMFHAVMPR